MLSRIIKKYNIITIIVAVLIFKLINDYQNILSDLNSVFGYVMSSMSYFIFGFAIAYLLNPAIKYLETKFKMKRYASLSIIYTIFILILTGFIIGIVPQLISGIRELADKTPSYIEKANIYFFNLENSIKDIIPNSDFKINTYLLAFVDSLVYRINYNSIGLAISNSASFLFTFLFGIILSIYMLATKETIINTVKKIINALFSEKYIRKIYHVSSVINSVFSKFIVGKFIDSFIIFLITFLIFSLMKFPLAPFLSLIIGVTNMIPYFGPYIGGAISVLIVIFYSPVQALQVGIAVLLIQQFDGWWLGPKILGDKIGINPILIIIGIVLGGNLMGIFGMFLGVPAVAAIKVLLYDDYILNKLEKKSKEN